MSSLNRPHFPSYVDAVLCNAAHDPMRPAIGTESGVVSYGQLAEAVRNATVRCHAAGLGAGTLVGLIVSDPVWQICLTCALHRLGVATAAINANEAKLKLGFTAVLVDEGRPEGFTGTMHVVDSSWFTEVGNARGNVPILAMGPTDLCRVALSSGTTGIPKAFAMSPEILWHRFTTYAMRSRFSVSEKILCGPLLRSHFAFAIAFSALISGKMMCFADSAETTLPIVSYFGVDLAIISVHQLSELANLQLKQYGGLSSLREIQAGGSTISDSLLLKVRRTIACPLVNTYASTEAGTAAWGAVEQLGEACNEGAVGFITPWTQVVACDHDGNELPLGETGNLKVSALGMADVYTPGMTKVLAPSSFFPGDHGRVTVNRMLFIAGRSTEIINIGGNKMAPEHIEEIIMSCDGVIDAAVFAVDSNSDFLQIWAAVVPGENYDVKEIMRRCAAQSNIISPTVIKIVNQIPRNSTGKIMRDQLRRELASSKLGA